MQYSLLITLVIMLTVSSTYAGFGCPFNQYQCHSHCKSVVHRAGGYCGGWLKFTCTCYRGRRSSMMGRSVVPEDYVIDERAADIVYEE